MIAATIGRKFLKVYNKEKGTNLSAKEFFEKEYFELFYNHPKYMQWVTNSPFVQMKKGQSVEHMSIDERLEKRHNLYAKISDAGTYDASIAIGFPASEEKEFATTSGQVTDLALPLAEDDIYFSWIGSGLGIGIKGGLSIFFDHPEILIALYKGWSIYRSYLNDPAFEHLRGNQINSWNGQWIAHVFGRHYKPLTPLSGFEGIQPAKDGKAEVRTISWVKVLTGIAQKMSTPVLMGYIYSLGQTNTTVGFIPFHLPQIKQPYELYRRLFGEQEYAICADVIEDLYGSAFSFQKACERGAIGLAALEPGHLRDYIPGYGKDTKMPDYKKAKDDTIITFKTYITWLIAMLKNEELWEIAGKAADNFLEYEKGAAKAKMDRINNVKAILDAPNRKYFIEALIKLVKDADVTELADIVNKMPADSFQYFNTLIRFRYAEKSKSKS